MEDLIVKLLDLGASGGLIVYLILKDRMFNTTMNNHLSHETASRDRLTGALTKLGDRIEGCPKRSKYGK
jgi:hypothetical protein